MALDSVLALPRREITCSLCDNLYQTPYSFTSCGHCFCYCCIHRNLNGSSRPVCPTCLQPVQITELYYNHQCQNIVRAVQSCQQGTAGISALYGRQEDQVRQTGSTLAEEASMQQLSLQKPAVNVHPVSAVSTSQAHDKDVQAVQVHQQDSADTSKAQDSFTVCQAATALLQRAQAAGDSSSSLSTPQLPASLWCYNREWALEVAALSPPDVAGRAAMDVELLALEAVLADLRQCLQTAGCDVFDVDKQPTVGSQPANAVLAAQQAAPRAKTGPAQAQCKLPQLPVTTMSSRNASTDCCVAQEPDGGQQNANPTRQAMLYGTAESLADIDAVMQARGYRLSCMPGPSGLPNTLASYGTELHSAGMDNSHSLDTDSPVVYQGLEAEITCSDQLPDCVAVEANMLRPKVPMHKCLVDKDPSAAQSCGSLQPAADEASPHTGAEAGSAEPNRPAARKPSAQQLLYQGMVDTGASHEDASGQPECPVVLPAADLAHSLSHSQQAAASSGGVATSDAILMHSQQPAVTATDGASDAVSPVHSQQQAPTCTGVANHDSFPMHSQQPETSQTEAINAPMQRQQPAVISHNLATDEAPLTHSQQPVGTPTTAGIGGDAAAAAAADDDACSMHAAAGEDTTVPDSVGHTQPGCQSYSHSQAVHTRSPSSSGHSHMPSDGASLEAALALAELASGEKQPRASTAQSPNAQPAELFPRSRNQWHHQQCDTDRVPLKTIQRAAAVQRQPLKPAWQQTSRAEPSWGGKGQRTRTRTHLHKPAPMGRTAMQRSRGTKHMRSLSSKQASSSKAVGFSPSRLGSDSTADEAEDTSKPSHTGGIPLGSALAGTQAGTSRAEPEVVGTNQPGCNLQGRMTPHTVRDESRLAFEGQGSRPEQAKVQQLQCRINDGEAAGCGNDNNDDDDDDFKPDVPRQPRGHGSSPRGSRKRARLLQPEACPGDMRPGVRWGAQGSPVGQVLLSWDATQRCWTQRIITAFSASKSLFHVKGDSTAAGWKDLTEVQWMQPGGPPHHCMLICQLVRQSIEIWWPQDKTYYKGTVTKYLPDKEKHHVLYDDGEEEDEDLASQQFRFCPALALLEESPLPVPGQPSVDWTDSSPHSIRKDTVPAEPPVSGYSPQPKLRQAVKPTAPLDATNARSPLSHNPEAAETASQGNNHKPVSAGQPNKSASPTGKQAALDAAAASDACIAAPTGKCELDAVLQQAAAPQRKADAFDYPASQGEDAGSQHSAPSTASPSKCNPGSNPVRGRGRKRAPGKQVASAKRQKQLQGTRGRAASKVPKSKQANYKQVADRAGHQPRRSRLAGGACQMGEATPSLSEPEVKAEAEPQGVLGKQACHQTPLTVTGAHARKPRQLDSQPDQQQEQLPLMQMEEQQQGHRRLGEQQDSQGCQQQQQHADGGVVEQADAGRTSKTEGGACNPARKVVVGSGLPRPKQDEIKRLCRRLRAHPGIAVDSHTTHIVVQVDAAGVGQQRSLKYFQGLARGCWLVSWAWVEACAAAGQWLDEEPFELAGDHFALGAPRTARLKRQPGAEGLFQGMSFWMGPGYKGTGVSPHQLAELLTCTGGHILESLPSCLTDGSTAHRQADACPDIHVLLFGENTAGPEQIRTIKEQTGTWPLLLSWVLDSLSSQKALPVAQYQERV